MQNYPLNYFLQILYRTRPSAIANIKGGEEYGQISGRVRFFDTQFGCLVETCIFNIPKLQSNFLGMHIHENGVCEGDFSSAGAHLGSGVHPNHMGDLLPVMNVNGSAFSIFLDNRFKSEDILGKTVILHANRDDFTSQPSGDSGDRIACGIITK